MSITKENISSKNLNLLTIFSMLLETQNVSEAARRLKMSQPNLSRALRLLREEFGDPLFVRASKGLVPTRKALELSGCVQEAVKAVQKVYSPMENDPQKFEGRFTIATTDYIEFLLAPCLSKCTSKEAPGITLNFRPSGGFLPKLPMEKGEVDLTVLVVREEIPPNYFFLDLFWDPYLCAVRKKHPILNKKVTIDRFLEFGHTMITPQGFLWAITDSKLQAMGKKRQLVMGTPNALSNVFAISQSDLILTATKRFIEGAQKHLPIETFKSPFEIDPIRIALVWHERSQQDPVHRWIRGKIKELLK